MRNLIVAATLSLLVACAPAHRTTTVHFVDPVALRSKCLAGGLPADCLATVEVGGLHAYASPDNWEEVARRICTGLTKPATAAYLGCYEAVGHELRHAVEGQFHK